METKILFNFLLRSWTFWLLFCVVLHVKAWYVKYFANIVIGRERRWHPCLIHQDNTSNFDCLITRCRKGTYSDMSFHIKQSICAILYCHFSCETLNQINVFSNSGTLPMLTIFLSSSIVKSRSISTGKPIIKQAWCF